MTIELKLTGFFIDKPQYATIEVDESQEAVQLPDGTILTVSQLKGEALDQYIFEKYIKNSPYDGRILETKFL